MDLSSRRGSHGVMLFANTSKIRGIVFPVRDVALRLRKTVLYVHKP